MPIILETARLCLREMAYADLDFVAEMLADPEVMRYFPKCCSRDEARDSIERQLDRYAQYGHGMWLAVDRHNGVPIGRAGLSMQRVGDELLPEVGYMVHRPYWRRGYAYEAARATRDYAFHALDKPRVISLIRPENLPSQAVARKLGMQPAGRTIHADLEHLVFSIARLDVHLPQSGEE